MLLSKYNPEIFFDCLDLLLCSECPYDWMDFGNYGCFYFVDERCYPTSWDNAKYFCQSRYSNSNLAQVSSPITQAILSSVADSYFSDQAWFIGGTDEFGVRSILILIESLF